jgi:hypothetical protein
MKLPYVEMLIVVRILNLSHSKVLQRYFWDHQSQGFPGFLFSSSRIIKKVKQVYGDMMIQARAKSKNRPV